MEHKSKVSQRSQKITMTAKSWLIHARLAVRSTITQMHRTRKQEAVQQCKIREVGPPAPLERSGLS